MTIDEIINEILTKSNEYSKEAYEKRYITSHHQHLCIF